MSQSIKLGTGRLSWPCKERIGDRYGLAGVEVAGTYCLECSPPEGQRGTLYAVIVETRRSGHIGDLFRGLYPAIPEVGERIKLGEGTLFVETLKEAGERHEYAGLRPDDNREIDWLDPKALYRCHDQTVDLWFDPTD